MPDPVFGELLILDDEPDISGSLCRLLTRQGQKATAISEPQAALDLIRAQPGRFSAMVTDFHMPGLNGLEVLRAVRALDPTLVVLLSSGSVTALTEAELFDAVLEKPFDLAQLNRAISGAQSRKA